MFDEWLRYVLNDNAMMVYDSHWTSSVPMDQNWMAHGCYPKVRFTTKRCSCLRRYIVSYPTRRCYVILGYDLECMHSVQLFYNQSGFPFLVVGRRYFVCCCYMSLSRHMSEVTSVSATNSLRHFAPLFLLPSLNKMLDWELSRELSGHYMYETTDSAHPSTSWPHHAKRRGWEWYFRYCLRHFLLLKARLFISSTVIVLLKRNRIKSKELSLARWLTSTHHDKKPDRKVSSEDHSRDKISGRKRDKRPTFHNHDNRHLSTDNTHVGIFKPPSSTGNSAEQDTLLPRQIMIAYHDARKFAKEFMGAVCRKCNTELTDAFDARYWFRRWYDECIESLIICLCQERCPKESCGAMACIGCGQKPRTDKYYVEYSGQKWIWCRQGGLLAATWALLARFDLFGSTLQAPNTQRARDGASSSSFSTTGSQGTRLTRKHVIDIYTRNGRRYQKENPNLKNSGKLEWVIEFTFGLVSRMWAVKHDHPHRIPASLKAMIELSLVHEKAAEYLRSVSLRDVVRKTSLYYEIFAWVNWLEKSLLT